MIPLFKFVLNGSVGEIYGDMAGVESESLFYRFVARVFRDGKEVKNFGTTWAGNEVDANEFYRSILAAYLNDFKGIKFEFVSDLIRNLKAEWLYYLDFEFDGRRIPAMAYTSSGDKARIAAVEENGFAYYADDVGGYDVFIAIRSNGEIASTVGAFVVGALVEAARNEKLVYATKELREWLAGFDDVDLEYLDGLAG